MTFAARLLALVAVLTLTAQPALCACVMTDAAPPVAAMAHDAQDPCHDAAPHAPLSHKACAHHEVSLSPSSGALLTPVHLGAAKIVIAAFAVVPPPALMIERRPPKAGPDPPQAVRTLVALKTLLLT